MASTAPIYADFIIAYPQFASMDELLVVQPQLDLSGMLLDAGAWGDFYSYAVGLDTAHCLTLNSLSQSGTLGALQGAAGPMTSVSAAGMSTSFQSFNINEKAQSEKWYTKTLYGQQFLRLRNAVIVPGLLTSSDVNGFLASVLGPVTPVLP